MELANLHCNKNTVPGDKSALQVPPPLRPYPEYSRANSYPWSPFPPRRARPGPCPHSPTRKAGRGLPKPEQEKGSKGRICSTIFGVRLALPSGVYRGCSITRSSSLRNLVCVNNCDPRETSVCGSSIVKVRQRSVCVCGTSL